MEATPLGLVFGVSLIVIARLTHRNKVIAIKINVKPKPKAKPNGQGQAQGAGEITLISLYLLCIVT